ncbi:MAG: UDP-N-acetylmuramate--L-alanine ligase, partial [Acidobacteria bacterium]|nr:UDP-N-acetylmuramate--L-alanine ligase [Acidobacteriota bacterium]
MPDPASFDLVAPRRIHIIGAGGAGMSGLAKFLSQLGHRVTGSDLKPSSLLDGLADSGVETWVGHRPERLGDIELVVASTAVPESDPELRAAVDAGLTVWRRPALLDALTAAIPTVGIAGTHGKTTSSACLGHVLADCGWDPTVLVGGDVIQWEQSNLRVGQSPWWVAEADESDGSFLSLSPEAVLLTNIEADHLDHYKTEANLESAFEAFVQRLPADGMLVYCRDDQGATRVSSRFPGRRVGYGMQETADVRVKVDQMGPGNMEMVFSAGEEKWRARTSVMGHHNALNFAGVFALGRALGIGAARILDAISGFRGVARRQQFVGCARGYRIYDDYAHHPTEIRATLQLFQEIYPDKITVVFQPHLYSRTARLAGDFAEALASADRVFVCEIYGAREESVPGVSGELIV